MSEKIKRAESGIPDVSAHRQLSPREEAALDAGKSRWLPRVFQSYGTPIPDLMASPLKTGLIFGLPAGVIGAGLGSAIGGATMGKNHSATGALLGGLGAGGLAALAAGMDREAKNEGLEELMRRMPEGAAKRDLEADPQYQADFLGWDNNKIVATARARYYRPTERFSKRTADMADARARYNERHKTSSSNEDVSMSEKQSAFGFGVPAGALAGLITSKKNKRLRAVGRGAIKGLGSDVGSGLGMIPGALIGGGLGMLGGPAGVMAGAGLGAGLGGLGGAYLGANTMNEVLGPYENDKKQNNNTREDEEGDEDVNETRKAAQALLNNTTLTLAEKMAHYKVLLEKSAQGTGSPAAAANANVPNTMDHLFGVGGAPESTLANEISRRAGQLNNARIGAGNWLGENVLHPAAAGISGAATAANNSGVAETARQLVGYGDRRSTLYDETAKRLGQLNDARLSAGKAIGENVLYPTAKGMYNAGATAVDAAGKGLSAANNARIGAGNWLGENVLYPAAKGVYNAPGAVGGAIASLFKKEPPPSLMQQIMNSKYTPYALGGAAALGLGGLGYAAMSGGKKKKKQRPEEDEENDMAYGKAANVNWYQIARMRQKQSMIPTPYALPMAPAAIKAMIAASKPTLLSRLGNLPTWAKVTGGLGAAGGTGAGLGALGGLFAGKDPSLLQQVMDYKYTPHIAAGLGAAGVLGGAAYMGSNAGKDEAKKKKKPAPEKQADLASMGLGAGGGAALGGGLGALYGALNPGQERDPDSGRTRRRSRLMAALRGLAAGGVAGGLGGAALGHFQPGIPNAALDQLGMGRELKLPPPPTGAENMAANVNRMTPQQRQLHDVIMQRNKVKAPATPDPIEYARAQATVNNMGEEPGTNSMTGAPNPAMAAQMAQQ